MLILWIALIAGRLWFLGRQIEALPTVAGAPGFKRASRAAAIMLESGSVYCICLILVITLGTKQVVLDATPQIVVSKFSADAIGIQTFNEF